MNTCYEDMMSTEKENNTRHNYINYMEQAAAYGLDELMELTKIYADADCESLAPNVRMQMKLEMMYVTMRICTQEKYDSFDDYMEYVDILIDRIKDFGIQCLTEMEQIFLPAYAFCFRILDEE